MKNSSRIFRSCLLAAIVVPGFAQAIVIRHDVPDAQYLALGAQFTGVGTIIAGGSGGTGALIAPNWVITAAHVVGNNTSASFTLNGTVYNSNGVFTQAGWTLTNGMDVALVRLNQNVNGNPQIYSLFQGNPIGQTVYSVGFGATGTGLTGFTHTDGNRRGMTNLIEAYWAGSNNTVFLSDFDSPAGNTSLFGTLFPTALEGQVAPGDSGGPAFFDVGGGNYQLAGIASFMFSQGQTNGMYGNGSGWHRVDANMAWIHQTSGVPEPSTMILVGIGIAGLVARRRARK
ncbi:trypsin-like serine protease [Kamptonema cortianum]|nr:trypsin-like serine protease [Geitlerinema splendidum]MDK3158472.1 trypsin-like serine protease [Kamptonema cortianum]